MTSTHTTASGNTLSASGNAITLTLTDGTATDYTMYRDQYTEPVIAMYADAIRKAGKQAADYRMWMGKCYDLASAAWIDEQITAISIRSAAELAREQIIGRYHSDMREAQRAHEDNIEMEQRWAADRRDLALSAWSQQYPLEAAAMASAERRASLLAEASGLESDALAAGSYDADGWLSPSDQNARAAAYRTRAAELRHEASNV